MLSVYPAFSYTVLGLNPELLVPQGTDPTAYSCILTLRRRVTVVSSERLCFQNAPCWNTPKLARWSVDALVVLYVQEYHQSTSCLSALFHACAHIEKVCSLPLCVSDVQCSQDFCTPGHMYVI